MNRIDMATELFVRAPGEIVPLPETEAEKMRKAVLSAQDIDTAMNILEEGMMSKYIKAGRFNEMLDIIDELHLRPFMEPAATCFYLKQGSICESMLDYSLAIDYYSLGIQAYAIKVEPDDRFGYWLFNNSSFCHDYEMLFPEAQRLAEKAISIDSRRHNAWKNLGVSFEHQDKHVEAAACYLASYIKCSGGSDPRPMMHLERIFKRHDGLQDKFADQAEKEMGNIFSGPFKDFCLGETYYYCGHFDKAVSSYEKFFSVAPSGYTGCLEYVQMRIKELKELKQIEAQLA
jgi:tetratricopeptide (TPR) repeat protein